MGQLNTESLDVMIRGAHTAWRKIDEVDVKILEGLSLLGPRNLTLISEHLGMPTTTVRYRVRRMISESILSLHLNPYHTFLGLKKAVVFIEAVPGHEEDLLDYLRVNDFWLFLCRIYGPYEGCGGIWTIPRDDTRSFEAYLGSLQDMGVARTVEVNWSTCFEGIPVRSRWFSIEDDAWRFNWDEWIKEVETIEGELPITLVEPNDWPLKADYTDLLLIKELEKDGGTTLTDISKALDISLEKVKYHFREHVSKRGLIEGYQVSIYPYPFPVSEILFFKFEFDSYDKMRRFALSIHDKPFPRFIGKVLGEDALVSQIYIPKWEFRRFIRSLSTLIKMDILKGYHYVIQDMFQTWRQTIPYDHFKNGGWDYDDWNQREELKRIRDEKSFSVLNQTLTR